MLSPFSFGLPVEFIGNPRDQRPKAIEVHKDLKEGNCNTLLNQYVLQLLLFCRVVEFLSSHKLGQEARRDLLRHCDVIRKQCPPVPIVSYTRTVNYICLESNATIIRTGWQKKFNRELSLYVRWRDIYWEGFFGERTSSLSEGRKISEVQGTCEALLTLNNV